MDIVKIIDNKIAYYQNIKSNKSKYEKRILTIKIEELQSLKTTIIYKQRTEK